MDGDCLILLASPFPSMCRSTDAEIFIITIIFAELVLVSMVCVQPANSPQSQQCGAVAKPSRAGGDGAIQVPAVLLGAHHRPGVPGQAAPSSVRQLQQAPGGATEHVRWSSQTLLEDRSRGTRN